MVMVCPTLKDMFLMVIPLWKKISARMIHPLIIISSWAQDRTPLQQLLPFFSRIHVFPIIPTRAKVPGSGSSPLADAQDGDGEPQLKVQYGPDWQEKWKIKRVVETLSSAQ